MSLFVIVFLATLICIGFVLPFIFAVSLMYYVGKQLEIGDVSLGNILKTILFYFFSGIIFLSIFFVFAIRPFAKISAINHNPYLAIFLLSSLLAIGAFCFIIHFKTFYVFVKRFYDMDLVKKIFLYISTTATVYFLMWFYVPAIKIFLYYSEIALSK